MVLVKNLKKSLLFGLLLSLFAVSNSFPMLDEVMDSKYVKSNEIKHIIFDVGEVLVDARPEDVYSLMVFMGKFSKVFKDYMRGKLSEKTCKWFTEEFKTLDNTSEVIKKVFYGSIAFARQTLKQKLTAKTFLPLLKAEILLRKDEIFKNIFQKMLKKNEKLQRHLKKRKKKITSAKQAVTFLQELADDFTKNLTKYVTLLPAGVALLNVAVEAGYDCYVLSDFPKEWYKTICNAYPRVFDLFKGHVVSRWV